MKRHTWRMVLLWSVCLVGTLMVGGFAHAQVGREERLTTSAVAPPTSGMQTAQPPRVKIWTDKGDDKSGNTPIYYLGERIYISFQVDKDCYLTLYDIDSTGNINILFPNPYNQDNMVRGGRIYTVPTTNYAYDLVIKGPSGKEILFALASTHVYYHWQYGSNMPPPVWSDQWGTPLNWGHTGTYDESVTSPRFEKRLQVYEETNLAGLTLAKVKQQLSLNTTVACMVPQTQRECECTFYVTMPPY